MGLSQLEICNHALLKVGADTITTLTSPASTDDGTKRSIDLCNLFFDQAYDEILRIYPWNSATCRTKLHLKEIDDTTPAQILVVDSNVPDVNGQFLFDSTDGVHNKFIKSGVNRIEYDGSWTIYDSLNNVASTNPNEGENGNPPRTKWIVNNISEGNTPPELQFKELFGYANYAIKPQDIIRLVDVYSNEDMSDDRTSWVLEGDFILSDEEALYVKYIAKPTDITTLDSLCTNALICNLAMKLCSPLQLDDKWAKRINDELYGVILPQARSIDTFENKELLLEESSWLLGREIDYPVV